MLLFHRAMSVRDGKARSRAILALFGLDPAPPSFRRARPRVRRPRRLGSSVLGTVFKSVVPDLFRKSARQEKGGTFPLAVCENKRAEIDGEHPNENASVSVFPPTNIWSGAAAASRRMRDKGSGGASGSKALLVFPAQPAPLSSLDDFRRWEKLHPFRTGRFRKRHGDI